MIQGRFDMKMMKNLSKTGKKKIDFIKLFVSIAGVLLIGFISSFFSAGSIDSWYQTLARPSFNPPNWIFGPVWTILYIVIGISFYLVWMSDAKDDIKKKAYLIFAVQLALNFIWSILFFGNQMIFGAFVEIIFLWIAILLNILIFYKISRLAGGLLVPYFLWVSFAALLNYSLWVLNK